MGAGGGGSCGFCPGSRAPAPAASAAAWICLGQPGTERRRGEEEEEAAAEEAREEEEEEEVEEKSPKPGGEPKCIKGAAAGAGEQGRGGRAGGGSGREVWRAEQRGGPTGASAAPRPPPLRALARARTHSLARTPRGPRGRSRQAAPAE
jgi:hypothetical protein